MNINTIKSFFKEILKLFIILTIFLNVVSYFKSSDINKNKLDIKTFTLIDGSSYKIQNNKPLIIHFWATWCPICKIEATNIESLSKDFQVITIAVESGSNIEVQKYIKEHNLQFKVVNDANGYFANIFNIKGYPSTLFYDKNSNNQFNEIGYTSTFGLYLRAYLLDFLL